MDASDVYISIFIIERTKHNTASASSLNLRYHARSATLFSLVNGDEKLRCGAGGLFMRSFKNFCPTIRIPIPRLPGFVLSMQMGQIVTSYTEKMSSSGRFH
jgi:hypothetical protein